MARGWESKSVELQIESSEGDRCTAAPQKRLTAAQVALHWKRDSLLLSKSRVLQQLQVDLSPRYREMLNGALADLEKQLAQLDDGGTHA
jgi:hypothetical protein